MAGNSKLHHGFFLLPKTVDSDRPIAPPAKQIRWWQLVKADIMEDWNYLSRAHQQKKQEEQGPVWVATLTKRMQVQRTQEHSQCSLICKKAFEKVQLTVVWNCGVYLKFTVLLLRMLCGCFLRTREECWLKAVRGTSADIHSNSAMEQVECVVAAIVDVGRHDGICSRCGQKS